MSDTKANAAFHPYATREEALEAEVRALRAENERLIVRAKRARSITRIWAAEEEAEALRARLDAVIAECDAADESNRTDPDPHEYGLVWTYRIRQAATP